MRARGASAFSGCSAWVAGAKRARLLQGMLQENSGYVPFSARSLVAPFLQALYLLAASSMLTCVAPLLLRGRLH